MSSINAITVSGNLTHDPELRTTAADVPYVRLRVAVSRRVRVGERWEDRHEGYFTVTAWRDLATNARTSLRRGDRVTATGRLVRRSFEAVGDDGEPLTRHVHEIEADELGPSLRWRSWARLEPRPVDLPAQGAATGPDVGPPAEDDPLDADVVEGDVTRAA